MQNSNAHAICIRIRGKQYVGIDALAKPKPKLKRRTILWIGVRTSREVAIRIPLLVNDAHVIETHTLEDARHALKTRAVKRSIYNL